MMSGRRRSSQGQSSLGYLFGESGQQQGNNQSNVSSPTVISISGGGQSSLGYLFGSNALEQQSNHETKRSSPSLSVPPYGTDDVVEESRENPLSSLSKKDDNILFDKSYVYHKTDAENSKDFLMTGRPSTRVTSVPGGASSLGYLFGDK